MLSLLMRGCLFWRQIKSIKEIPIISTSWWCGDVNHDDDYDFDEDDDDHEDNDHNDDYVSIMMTWCWCHPHKLLHTHPRSQRGCDLVEKVVIVILVLLQDIIIVIVIIAIIRKLLVSWMLSSFSAVSLSQSSQPSSQAQGQASSHFHPIIRASLIWYYPVTRFQYDPIWSTMIHYGLVWSKSQLFDSHLPPPQPPYLMLWQPLSWKITILKIVHR